MRIRTLLLLPLVVMLSGCAMLTGFSNSNASGYRTWSREECVPYTRRVSGVNLYGDAWTWWNQAAGKYARGNTPETGAVLVLAKTQKLRHGHLAMVTQLVDNDEVFVTHTNWGSGFFSRRVVYETLRAKDVSTTNDWTLVRFWNNKAGGFGSPYPAMGFIYNRQP